MHYLIKWVGFPLHECTWEKIQNIDPHGNLKQHVHSLDQMTTTKMEDYLGDRTILGEWASRNGSRSSLAEDEEVKRENGKSQCESECVKEENGPDNLADLEGQNQGTESQKSGREGVNSTWGVEIRHKCQRGDKRAQIVESLRDSKSSVRVSSKNGNCFEEMENRANRRDSLGRNVESSSSIIDVINTLNVGVCGCQSVKKQGNKQDKMKADGREQGRKGGSGRGRRESGTEEENKGRTCPIDLNKSQELERRGGKQKDQLPVNERGCVTSQLSGIANTRTSESRNPQKRIVPRRGLRPEPSLGEDVLVAPVKEEEHFSFRDSANLANNQVPENIKAKKECSDFSRDENLISKDFGSLRNEVGRLGKEAKSEGDNGETTNDTNFETENVSLMERQKHLMTQDWEQDQGLQIRIEEIKKSYSHFYEVLSIMFCYIQTIRSEV